MRTSFLLSSCLLVAAAAVGCSSTPVPHHPDAGIDPNAMDSGAGDDAGGGGTYTMTTVADAVTSGPSALSAVEFDNVVVVAAYSYMSSGATTGTFYVQDQAPGSSTGVAVYVAGTDGVTFPSVGDIVTVQGSFSTFGGILQVSSYTAMMIPLTVTNTGTGGMSSGGAYDPAGVATMVSPITDYAHTNMDAHAEQLGNVLQFAGPLAITVPSPAGFANTSATGTKKPVGFEVTGGVWVNDSNVYFNCLKGKGPDGGTLTPDLTGGLRGVWDRFADRGSDGGTVYPVLIPMTCDDLNPTGYDAGTPTADAGNPTADAGNPTADAGNPTADAGTQMVDAGTTPAANSVQGVLGGGTTARAAEVDNAVVIAAYSYTSTAGATSGTFYLQDQGPNSSTGIEVYVASTDAVTFPSVGDIVTVKGYLSIYSASVQIASSKSPATPLVVTNTGSGGMSSSGAYSPAGSPTMVSSTTGYAATVTNAHAEQLGTAIQFAGPLTVSSMTAPGLIHTKADGGTVSEGFEITGGVYVYDANTYFNCMKGQASDGGTLYPTLTTGIRGVWSRYQDGTTGKVYPVLIPMDCSDFAP